ncbi:extracellular triacylglycerol lipase [Grosmannia clavigera kw1407]|uniref:Extracellular triacylglycerol lipase n=1 Tax=Grosmannia clavigera (strain kw1407 / UAMH 11150) TaxID=655863 RepID=F0XHB8_GROCL|nr:extracellular triacylglycerol lipase [Grosmannia clavigera kw1407]EFX02689.1 extracellular triacylglycerol lipase [Grosmannia clavigera kw1407]
MKLLRSAIILFGAGLATSAAVPERQHQAVLSVGDAQDGPLISSSSTTLFGSLERLARLVDIAYCVGTAGTGVAPPFSCVSRCHEFPELRLVASWNTGVLLGDSCGFVAADDGRREVFVVFRGTYSLTNTVEDLRTVPQDYKPYPGTALACRNCTVHAGFFDSWQSARPLVLPAVAAARDPSSSPDTQATQPLSPYTVRLVGHSLGGAVAALAGLEMRTSLGWDDVHVTTFGQPRIGNKGLAAFVETVFGLDNNNNNNNNMTMTTTTTNSFRRVTHRNDPVPLLPLAEWGFRSHAGEIFIDKHDLPPSPDDLLLCRGRDDPACIAGPSSDSLYGSLPRLRLWELFFAHRDYFWRLGLCFPGGDPADRWRNVHYGDPSADEL